MCAGAGVEVTDDLMFCAESGWGLSLNRWREGAAMETLSYEDIVQLFLEKVRSAENDEVDAAVDRLFQQRKWPSVGVSDARRLMPHLQRWCGRAIKDPSTRKKNFQRLVVFGKYDFAARLLIEAVADCDARLSSQSERADIRHFIDVLSKRPEYIKHRDSVVQRCRAERIAKEEQQRRRLREPLLAFLDELVGIDRQVDFPDQGLSELDEQLCLLWSNNRTGLAKPLGLLQVIDDYHAMRLYSARTAEHAAVSYYSQLRFVVEDVSIHQVTGESHRWKTHDLEVDGRPIDVKNSRRSFSSPGSYSEHCVVNWKLHDRAGSSIKIAGVLSDYVTAGSYLAGYSGSAVFLGEVSREELVKTALWFQNRTNGLLQFIDITKPRYFPGWVFEYPDEHYGEVGLDPLAVSAAIERATSSGLSVEDVPRSLILFTPPELGLKFFPSDAQIVCSLIEMRDAVGLSRMSAVLFVLSEFVLAVRGVRHSFDAERLAHYIFFEARSGQRNHQRPFGKLDTESFVAEMLKALGCAWELARERLRRFQKFQLVGANILRGDAGDGEWTTVLAYCGGFLVGRIKARCGKSPLVIGDASVCHHCLHLICPKCGWCTEGCPQVHENPLRVPQAAGPPSSFHTVETDGASFD